MRPASFLLSGFSTSEVDGKNRGLALSRKFLSFLSWCRIIFDGCCPFLSLGNAYPSALSPAATGRGVDSLLPLPRCSPSRAAAAPGERRGVNGLCVRVISVSHFTCGSLNWGSRPANLPLPFIAAMNFR